MGDTTRGRVYRVAPKGHKPFVPKVNLTTNQGIVAALASGNLAVRYMAMAKLDGMKADEAIKLLEPVAKQTGNAALRARALWQIARVGKGKAGANALVVGLFNDTDP